MSGSDLSPDDEPVTVEVFVVAPDIQESTFSGEILVVNEDDSSDYETISVSLATPRNKDLNFQLISLFFDKVLQTKSFHTLSLRFMLNNLKGDNFEIL
jgi:hypothetical protein